MWTQHLSYYIIHSPTENWWTKKMLHQKVQKTFANTQKHILYKTDDADATKP